MVIVISQYFPALTNTCLVFTCKLFYCNLGRFMLAIFIVMHSLWAFIFLLQLQITWCNLHFCKPQWLYILFSNLWFHFTGVCKMFYLEPDFRKATWVTLLKSCKHFYSFVKEISTELLEFRVYRYLASISLSSQPRTDAPNIHDDAWSAAKRQDVSNSRLVPYTYSHHSVTESLLWWINNNVVA